MKNLPAGAARFVIKKIDKAWRVYDKARGSFPVVGAEWGGSVQQDVDETAAQAEADRLNGVAPAAETVELAEDPGDTSSVTEDPAADPQEETVELADYGVMSKEERAAYEDGLIEKVTY